MWRAEMRTPWDHLIKIFNNVLFIDDVVFCASVASVCRFPDNRSVSSKVCCWCFNRSWIYRWKDEALFSLSLSHYMSWLVVGTDCMLCNMFFILHWKSLAGAICISAVRCCFTMGFMVRNNQWSSCLHPSLLSVYFPSCIIVFHPISFFHIFFK